MSEIVKNRKRYMPPKDLWLYPDRGIMKWMGFFFSDYTDSMVEARNDERPVLPKPIMDSAEINEILDDSYRNKSKIIIQSSTIYDGQLLPDLIGAVYGFSDGIIYLIDNNGRLAKIKTAEIRNVAYKDTKKWWDNESINRIQATS